MHPSYSLTHTHAHTYTCEHKRPGTLSKQLADGNPLCLESSFPTAPEDKDAQGRATQTCAHPSFHVSLLQSCQPYCEYPGPQKHVSAIQTVRLRENGVGTARM